MKKTIEEIDFDKGDGLVPVIVQDVNSKEVLTLAYANKESLALTQKTGNSWFWSRSRNRLWMKGEESGIIYLVEPAGPACHTGDRVCFHNSL
ncbi:MAG: phosphoribosyl-AMP cyclohydrolase [Thaumarchaeota archaeon]|nr:MAG: phosphoribosyl-AMP cyclohydrolase [Nitrososphaerota archaeon]